ncbi:hypothetical protein FOL47_006180 [Perkinsus chesapeaki]|uniref:Uncharacterized protein n=1 Tax=Perkinsus chesapeaki TaxID=330153 RepID=A0A7J6LTQ9_PERCH|nr:hypothetical protein FOL47_006180 [Perkinsus chesapeaki]
MFSIYAITGLLTVAATAKHVTPNGEYCGSGHHWRSLMVKVNEESATFDVSGIANVSGAAPFYLSDIPFQMNELGNEIVVLNKDTTPGDHPIGGFGYPLPSFTAVGYDATYDLIMATYNDEYLLCGHSKCGAESTAEDNKFGPNGHYCCSSKHWQYIQFRVNFNADTFTGTVAVGGIARLPHASPWYLSDMPFTLDSEMSLLTVHKETESRRSLRATIGGFGYPVPSWTSLSFNASSNTITAPYRGDLMELAAENF